MDCCLGPGNTAAGRQRNARDSRSHHRHQDDRKLAHEASLGARNDERPAEAGRARSRCFRSELKKVDQEARLQLARLQLALVGSMLLSRLEHWVCA